MKPPTLPQFSRNLLVSAGLAILLAVTFVAYVSSQLQVNRANELRYRSYLLADELRQSGDDLTRMIRTYAVTGDPVYKQHFQDILDIRDGRKPRPENYSRPYWDLVLGGDPVPRPDRSAVTLLEEMRKAGFTAAEFAKLAQAKANSDALTGPERQAMRLLESPGPEDDANWHKAVRLLHDKNYHAAKFSVMKPIEEFMALVDQRTLQAVNAAQARATGLRYVFAALGLALLVMLRRTYVALGDTLGGSLSELHRQIAQIGRGDFETAIALRPERQDSVLGWLSVTQARLQEVEQSNRRLNTELEQRVAQRTSELESANKELEAFTYSVAHDLRTPLRAIDGFAQVLLEDCSAKLDDSGRDSLHRVRDAAQRMGHLIDDLLALSRVTRGELEMGRVDLSALVQSAVAALQQAMPEREVEVTITPAIGARGDARLLDIIVRNLLGNAWKFTARTDRARISFAAEQQAGELVFRVTDNGAGFDPAHVNDLFRPFQRLHTASEFPGTGIGLAIVQRAIARMGGRVWAEGAVGKGATFFFSLPHSTAGPEIGHG